MHDSTLNYDAPTTTSSKDRWCTIQPGGRVQVVLIDEVQRPGYTTSDSTSRVLLLNLNTITIPKIPKIIPKNYDWKNFVQIRAFNVQDFNVQDTIILLLGLKEGPNEICKVLNLQRSNKKIL